MAKKTKEPIMQTLKGLRKGEVASFSLDRVLSVRSSCSLLSLQDKLKFRTKTDRETRTVVVERL